MPEQPEIPSMNRPLQPDLWYCRHPNREVFDVGPYPSREEAVEQGPEDMGLRGAVWFEIGRMVPVVPEINPALVKNTLLVPAVGHPAPQARKYMDAVTAAFRPPAAGPARADSLMDALNLTLAGWLTTNELWPTFGTVEDVESVLANGVANGPKPHPEGPLRKRCGFTWTANNRQHSCELLEGHTDHHLAGTYGHVNAAALKVPRCEYTATIAGEQYQCIHDAGHTGAHLIDEPRPGECGRPIIGTDGMNERCKAPHGHAGPCGPF